jgi:hypothetical protein
MPDCPKENSLEIERKKTRKKERKKLGNEYDFSDSVDWLNESVGDTNSAPWRVCVGVVKGRLFKVAPSNYYISPCFPHFHILKNAKLLQNMKICSLCLAMVLALLNNTNIF